MIHVVEHSDGKIYSLDNRRLAVFRLLRFVRKYGKIKVSVVLPNPAEWRRKFDEGCDHTRITVRGINQVIGPTEEETTFPLQRIRAAMRDTVLVHHACVAAILDGMDSGDEGEEEVGQRPSNARQALKIPARKKNAADQRRGNKSTGALDFPNGLEPFAAGKARYAYRCRATGGCVQGFSEGSYLVLKAFKPEFKHLEITSADVAMQQEAARLAELFNEVAHPTQNGEPCLVHVRDAALVRFERDRLAANGTVALPKATNFMLEREIFGEFRKFNSNNGWSSKTASEIPNALSHWTWATQQKLLCDLQGYQGKPPGPKYLGSRYYYLFTDPAIMSADKRYGVTDLGMQGVENWFSVHECNAICKALGVAHLRPASRRTLPVESSSSYRETQNSYGPKAALRPAVAAPALAAIGEEYYDSDYDSD
eukprot:CAMPEP_0179202808 /NCGR_PEP_ID=MMETSP0796-20121207/101045_1 /TAXON_ID=73915 /ORGANISM="Pyrodinium bahamense, Strain pbaha01" /LENGTH=423 /DNA_ID=CAMNT_0020907579 /DNA_START=165 /DNA_END=1436 /DNA_ORIENTATION=-